MPDWLPPISTQVDADLSVLALRLVLSWLCGWCVALIARIKSAPDSGQHLTLTLVLMSVLIAMATQIIGDNIARAFSLVGALSIVRFRAAVSSTRDVAFVLAAVVVGMAIGAGQYWVAFLGLITLTWATQFNGERPANKASESTTKTKNQWRLTMKVGLHSIGGWEDELKRLTKSYEIVSAETARRGGSLELVYRYEPLEGSDASQLIAALNAIPTVESLATKPL
ncbi:DUF4956 domain-containing protein [Rhodopirellula sp. JC740]|uniref:DUF4956 domain-containing protein n=1 Tax=Rhodopirellula halodulae TaxID=2894198 RepID=A0ABS8NK13_9BACT|nr:MULTISPECIES: DUF4956 domain-containing protein [unclassified Rhodopirellula]MCC9642806.1 DUF4956 domain-containing protein [Rhodopirellula sp. JC740]MCC9656180.1 DUF4956 domain-containing protein [Rhodopirellula sp. JC737]